MKYHILLWVCFPHRSLHLRYFSPMSNRFTYPDRLLVCRGSNSFGNFLLCGHHNPKLPACPDSNWPNLYYLGVSLTVPAQTKATMIVLSGFILIISIVSCQVTTSERDQQNLRLVNNRTILSTHERWNKKYGTWLQHFIFVAVKIIQMELHVQNGASTLHVTLKWQDAGRYLWCDSIYRMSQLFQRWNFEFKGHCKRSNNHPCEVRSWEMFIHPCCCGDCDNPKVTQKYLFISLL